MSPNMARFKFYAKVIPIINTTELTLDTGKTWEQELETYVPDWDSKMYLVKRLTSSKNVHEMTEKICILTQEYRQKREKYAVEILLKSWGTGWNSTVTSDFETFTNPQLSPSSETMVTKETDLGKKKVLPIIFRHGLPNQTPIHLQFPEDEDDYYGGGGKMSQQDPDNVSICTEVEQGELDIRDLVQVDVKTTLVNNLRSLQIAQEDLKQFKRDNPNRWAKAFSMLPSSFNSVVDLIFLRDN